MQHTEEGRRGLTISTGELPSSFDPVISEWGNPLVHGTRGLLRGYGYNASIV